jgi:hypothetical protein
MHRRSLADTLTDLASGALAAHDVPVVRTRRLEISVPLEVWIRSGRREIEILADLPLWRWRTVFDQTPSRLHVSWEEVDAS